MADRAMSIALPAIVFGSRLQSLLICPCRLLPSPCSSDERFVVFVKKFFRAIVAMSAWEL
jgi:hypothetical protein